MACREVVYPWTQTTRRQFPELSKPQASVLALWSLGMALARSCALMAVTVLLAAWQGRLEHTARQQLREWRYPAGKKRGDRRQELDVVTCFVPLLRWVLAGYTGTQLAVALDGTSLAEHFVVLTRSVVYRGCAIPAQMMVIVLADRGRYARWLFCRIRRLGWRHARGLPFLRVNAQGSFRPACARAGRLSTFVPRPGTTWQGTGVACTGKHHRLFGALLAGWLHGSLAAPDRSAARSGGGRLVRAARLDRARLQNHQASRLAVATHPHGGPRAGRPPLVGGRGRHTLAAPGQRRSGGRHS